MESARLEIDRGAVQSAVEDVGRSFEEALREGYRGKFETREGLGLVFETHRQADEFLVEMAAFDEETGRRLAHLSRRDDMGVRMILYFPGVGLAIR